MDNQKISKGSCKRPKSSPPTSKELGWPEFYNGVEKFGAFSISAAVRPPYNKDYGKPLYPGVN